MQNREDARSELSVEYALACVLYDPLADRIVSANAAADALYGYSPGRLEGLTLESIVPSPDDRELLRRATSAGFTSGGVHRRGDGSLINVDIHVQEGEVEGRFGRVVTILDVTERSRREAALVRSERQLADAQQLAHVGSFEWEYDSDSIRWSDELYRIYGLRPRQFEATYGAFLERIHPEDRERVNATVLRAVETGIPFEMEERVVRPDGTIRYLESRGRFSREEQRLIGICRDVTDLREATAQRDQLAAQETEARKKAEAAHAEIREILERVTDAFVALDRNWRYIFVNQRAGELFRRDPASLIGKHIWTEFPEGLGQPFHLAYERAMETQQFVQIEEYYPPYDKWFENRIYPSANGVAIYFQDVTARRRREDEVRELADRLARSEEFSLVMVTTVGIHGRFERVPRMLCRLLGYSEIEMAGADVERFIHPDDVEPDRQHRARIIRGEARSLDHEMRLITRDGGIVWVYINCSAVFDDEGTLTHFLVYLRDVTEKRNAEDRLRHLALHDELTGLPNRTLFHDRVQQAITHARATNRCLAVISIDLDTFKYVNDSLGHAVGDVVIREVAARLATRMRPTDTISRVGGDEFAILVEDVLDEAEAQELALTAREAFREPIDAGNSSVVITSSAGIAIFPRHGEDGETLFRNAESALNRAKESGQGTIRIFDQSMSARYRDRLLREQELRRAIETGQFQTWYQPILRTSDRKIVGVEALCRWQHPERGLVFPDEFIPLAEDTRMIVPIGESMLRNACIEVARWRALGHDLRLSVNLSVRQLQEISLLQRVDHILTETGFDARHLEFEITESTAMSNVDLTMSLLRELRHRGISIAIDDFGAGQTSLIYLRQFPINTIKIDKVFVNDILDDRTDAAIVKTVVELAHTLGLSATAEGVECEEQAALLSGFGCDLLQGYHFSRPIPAAALGALF